MPPGPWAMSVMMQTLQPSATSGANSVITPAGVMRAILAGADVNSVPSVNQRLPSEPLVMARGWLLAVGTLNCFRAPTGAATAALPSDSPRPPASTVAIARARSLDMTPSLGLACGPSEVSAGIHTPTIRQPRPSLDLLSVNADTYGRVLRIGLDHSEPVTTQRPEPSRGRRGRRVRSGRRGGRARRSRCLAGRDSDS